MDAENNGQHTEARSWNHESGLRFTCRECGKCCCGEPGNIWVTEKETEKIAAFLNLSETEFAARCLRRTSGRVSIRDIKERGYDCIFLDGKTRKCRIYPVRPSQCRLFPFWRSMLEDKEEWDFYAERCPGMNSGKLYTEKEIEEKLKQQNE